MLDNIEEIISSFQERVDVLQKDWNVLSEAAASTNRNSSLGNQINMLKTKLDFLQSQHTGIIIDLGHIKSELCREQLHNNIFYKDFESHQQGNKENVEPTKIIKKRAIESLFGAEHFNEPTFSFFKKERHVDEANEVAPLLNELPSKYKAWKKQYLDGFRNKTAMGSAAGGNYQLLMTDCPKSVAELYEEFYTDTKPQILKFEEKFGAGQLSKLPKLRTYQRRSALVNAINKYAKCCNISVEQSIEYFQNIVDDNDKTIPWLYNNLAKIMEQYAIPQ